MFSFTRLALVAAVIPLVAATNCNKGSFYYSNTARCIPENGNNTPDAGTAPAGVSCPQGSWYWSKGSKCCNPTSGNHSPTPSCPEGYTFNQKGSACIKTPTTPHNPTDCSNGYFYWDPRKACLPSGGPPSPPQPPSGTKCPPSWSWSSNSRCCTPHTPPPPQPPSCAGGWDWCDEIKQCQPHPPSPGGPQPSPKPQPGHGGYKRSLKARSANQCGQGLTACPIKTAAGLFADFECIDTKVEAESCGGCASTGEGTDCSVAIPNAFSVGCQNATCVLHKCKVGFSVSEDGKSCVPDLHVAARRDF